LELRGSVKRYRAVRVAAQVQPREVRAAGGEGEQGGAERRARPRANAPRRRKGSGSVAATLVFVLVRHRVSRHHVQVEEVVGKVEELQTGALAQGRWHGTRERVALQLQLGEPR
jgi:hypothetical protein